jgi:hypothetical protein
VTAYNPAEVERLIAEAREDDARMTNGPWHGDSVAGILFGDGNHEDGSIELAHMDGEAKEFDPVAIARTRNNLAAMVDQLEFARIEIDRLRHANASLVPGAMLTATELECLRVELEAARAEIERLRSAAERWSDAREDWQQRQTFSSRCTLDEAGDELQAVLHGRAAPTKGERAAAIVGTLAAMADPRPARPCPTCSKPGCRPQDHAGWDPSKDMP